jgi:uncharacterized protein (DUF58 family)
MVTRNGWLVLALAVAALVSGFALHYSEMVAVGLGLSLCLAIAVTTVRLRLPVEVDRVVSPGRVAEGEGAAGVITVTNPGSRRSGSKVATEQLGASRLRVVLPALDPGRSHSQSYRLPTDRRGCYTVGPLHIAHNDPLNLARATQQDTSEAALWVHPKTYRVSPIPTGRAQDIEGRPTGRNAPRGGIAFHSLREYEPGDDPRLIHWRSTARTGTLMVRHTVITNEPRLLIVLDSSAASYAADSFEDAVRVAASLMLAGADQHFPTELRTTGGIKARIDETGLGKTEVLDKLATVSATEDDAGLPALARMTARREHGVALGVVTGQPAPDKVGILGAMRTRFDMVTMVQVGERFGRPAIGIPGVLGVAAADALEFTQVWKRRIG